MIETAEQRMGAWVKWARLQRGWSQRTLANHLHDKGVKFDQSAVARIENGSRAIRVDEADALARVFGVSVSEMLQPTKLPQEALRLLGEARSHQQAANDKIDKFVELACDTEGWETDWESDPSVIGIAEIVDWLEDATDGALAMKIAGALTQARDDTSKFLANADTTAAFTVAYRSQGRGYREWEVDLFTADSRRVVLGRYSSELDALSLFLALVRKRGGRFSLDYQMTQAPEDALNAPDQERGEE